MPPLPPPECRPAVGERDPTAEIWRDKEDEEDTREGEEEESDSDEAVSRKASRRGKAPVG